MESFEFYGSEDLSFSRDIDRLLEYKNFLEKKRVIRIFDMNNRKKMQKKLFDRTRYSIDQADVKSKSYVDFSISNNQYTNLDRS